MVHLMRNCIMKNKESFTSFNFVKMEMVYSLSNFNKKNTKNSEVEPQTRHFTCLLIDFVLKL